MMITMITMITLLLSGCGESPSRGGSVELQSETGVERESQPLSFAERELKTGYRYDTENGDIIFNNRSGFGSTCVDKDGKLWGGSAGSKGAARFSMYVEPGDICTIKFYDGTVIDIKIDHKFPR